MPADITNDLDLHAYLDGELDAETTHEIEARLATDANFREELDRLRDLKVLVAKAFLNDLSEPVSPALLAATQVEHAVTEHPEIQPAPATRKHVEARRWLALCASMVIGLLGGYFLASSGPESTRPIDWVDQVANYHAMYTAQTLQHVDVEPGAQQAVLERMKVALQQDMAIPDLTDHGLTFKRSQLLSSAGKPVIQLAYLHAASGTPVALCLTPNGAPATTPAPGVAHEVNFVRWNDAGTDFVVVGHFSHEVLLDIVQTATSTPVLIRPG